MLNMFVGIYLPIADTIGDKISALIKHSDLKIPPLAICELNIHLMIRWYLKI